MTQQTRRGGRSDPKSAKPRASGGGRGVLEPELHTGHRVQPCRLCHPSSPFIFRCDARPDSHDYLFSARRLNNHKAFSKTRLERSPPSSRGSKKRPPLYTNRRAVFKLAPPLESNYNSEKTKQGKKKKSCSGCCKNRVENKARKRVSDIVCRSAPKHRSPPELVANCSDRIHQYFYAKRTAARTRAYFSPIVSFSTSVPKERGDLLCMESHRFCAAPSFSPMCLASSSWLGSR